MSGSGLAPLPLSRREIRPIQRFKLAHFFVGHAVNHLKSWLAGDRGRSASPCLTPARSPTAAGCVPSRTARLGVMCLSSARAQAFDRMRPPLMMVYCLRPFCRATNSHVPSERGGCHTSWSSCCCSNCHWSSRSARSSHRCWSCNRGNGATSSTRKKYGPHPNTRRMPPPSI